MNFRLLFVIVLMVAVMLPLAIAGQDKKDSCSVSITGCFNKGRIAGAPCEQSSSHDHRSHGEGQRQRCPEGQRTHDARRLQVRSPGDTRHQENAKGSRENNLAVSCSASDPGSDQCSIANAQFSADSHHGQEPPSVRIRIEHWGLNIGQIPIGHSAKLFSSNTLS